MPSFKLKPTSITISITGYQPQHGPRDANPGGLGSIGLNQFVQTICLAVVLCP
jgi:hypothetical protein